MPSVAKQPSKQEIKNALRQIRGELKHKYGVRRIGLFGSLVREDEQVVRDVDLLVEFERPVGLLFIHLADYLEEVLGRPVDLVTLMAIKENRRASVLEDVEYVEA
jgi:uncharacterized protein